MATTNVPFNRNSQPEGQDLARWLNDLARVAAGGPRILSVMQHMIDGDGSDAAHFTEVTSRYGFATNAKSKAAWDELNSVVAKLNTDASVSSMKSAIAQVLAKFGIV